MIGINMKLKNKEITSGLRTSSLTFELSWISLKTCLGSRNFSSSLSGARYPYRMKQT